MIEVFKPVRYGILIGLLVFILGIGWAFFLVLGHEKIHESLQYEAAHAASIKGDVNGGEHDMSMDGHMKKGGDGMEDHLHGAVQAREAAHAGLHDNLLMALSHARLVRGHVHAMGLGLVTIAVSLGLAFTSVSARIKTIASALTGVGALVYPVAWIVMGYRTPALGPEGAELSVMTIAGTGVSLVLLGVLTSAAFIIKDIFKKS